MHSRSTSCHSRHALIIKVPQFPYTPVMPTYDVGGKDVTMGATRRKVTLDEKTEKDLLTL